MEPYKVHIPESCHIDWDKMTTTQRGKLCAQCDKEVYDFSGYSPIGLQQAFTKAAIERLDICGRFDHSQLVETPKNGFMSIKPKALSALQKFALAFFFSFLIGGINNSYAQGTPVNFEAINNDTLLLDHLDNWMTDCSNKTAGPPIVTVVVPPKDSTTVIVGDTTGIVDTAGVDNPIIDSDPFSAEVLGKWNNVHFDYDSDTLSVQAVEELDSLLARIRQLDFAYTIEVVGHTDSKGGYLYNKTLSERRAKAVEQYLISKGVQVAKVRGVSYQFPVKNNTSMVGRAANRRVEIMVERK